MLKRLKNVFGVRFFVYFVAFLSVKAFFIFAIMKDCWHKGSRERIPRLTPSTSDYDIPRATLTSAA